MVPNLDVGGDLFGYPERFFLAQSVFHSSRRPACVWPESLWATYLRSPARPGAVALVPAQPVPFRWSYMKDEASPVQLAATGVSMLAESQPGWPGGNEGRRVKSGCNGEWGIAPGCLVCGPGTSAARSIPRSAAWVNIRRVAKTMSSMSAK